MHRITVLLVAFVYAGYGRKLRIPRMKLSNGMRVEAIERWRSFVRPTEPNSHTLAKTKLVQVLASFVLTVKPTVVFPQSNLGNYVSGSRSCRGRCVTIDTIVDSGTTSAESQDRFVGILGGDTLKDKQIMKMKINLLLEEAWKLDKSGEEALDKNAEDALEKIQKIRSQVVDLILDAYGRRDESLDKSLKPVLTVEDYMELASDYFSIEATDALNMFRKIDRDQSGTLSLKEMKMALEPFFESNSAMQTLRYNALKSSNAQEVTLFASPSVISTDDVVGMTYLTQDLDIFLKGNFLLALVTSALFVNSLFSIIAPETLGLALYILQSLIYLVYCQVYWRYFRKDWWSTAALWLYTAGYLLFTDYYYKVFRAIHLSPLTWPGIPLSKTTDLVVAFCIWTLGSIPFFLSREARSDKNTRPNEPSGVRYKYDHTNPSARGGLLFFLGSLVFLASTFGPVELIDLEEQAAAYALFIWGRVEFIFGVLFNVKDTSAMLKAAVTWRSLTRGVKVTLPTLKERLAHLIFGVRSERICDGERCDL